MIVYYIDDGACRGTGSVALGRASTTVAIVGVRYARCGSDGIYRFLRSINNVCERVYMDVYDQYAIYRIYRMMCNLLYAVPIIMLRYLSVVVWPKDYYGLLKDFRFNFHKKKKIK